MDIIERNSETYAESAAIVEVKILTGLSSGHCELVREFYDI
jgi:hypothetical protein